MVLLLIAQLTIALNLPDYHVLMTPQTSAQAWANSEVVQDSVMLAFGLL